MRGALPDVTLAAVALLLVAIRLYGGATASTPAVECSAEVLGGAERSAPAAGATEVRAWAPAPGGKCWLANTLLLAASQLAGESIYVTPQIVEVLERFTPAVFAQAASVQAAPDISYVENRAFVPLAQQGYLAPLDDCRARHPEFAGIAANLWPQSTWDGKIWGAPAGLDVGILYFNKDKLRALNWPAAMIDSLPERIRTGAWTLDDMLHTIRQARALGVIAAGEGFWPNYHRRHTFWLVYLAYGGRIYDAERAKFVLRPAALAAAYRFHHTLLEEQMTPAQLMAHDWAGRWPGNAIWRNAEAHGQPLFWQTSTSFWPNYLDAVPETGEDGMAARTGLALFPAAAAGSPGLSWVHNYGWYVIASAQASGQQRQDAACAVIARALLPDVAAQYVRQSGKIVASAQAANPPAVAAGPFAALAPQLWEHGYAYPSFHPASKTVDDILIEFLARVERGELAPETAAEAASLRLQREVGDALLVE